MVSAHGTFELYRDAAGLYRFRLRAANGQVIASSLAYSGKAAARRGIEAVRTTAPTATLADGRAGAT
jgi:uncharacterized protein YegP (UPF0339 family)